MKIIGNEQWMTAAHRIEAYMADRLAELSCPELIREAMAYSLMAGGKRIRPVVMMDVAQLLGADLDAVMPLACALEMIHSYSLIHDDLPAMDNDVLRRGKPTNHVVFGEAQAILAGDGLSNLAYEVILQYAPVDSELLPRYLRAAAYLASCAGVCGMGGGQCMDLQAETVSISLEELTELERLKTGALLRASLVCGAMVAGADSDIVDALGRCGDAMGILFQIRDDILDVESDEATLGKSIGKDAAQGKTTFVTALGLQGAKDMADAYDRKALQELQTVPQALRNYLVDLTQDLLERNH